MVCMLSGLPLTIIIRYNIIDAFKKKSQMNVNSSQTFYLMSHTHTHTFDFTSFQAENYLPLTFDIVYPQQSGHVHLKPTG